MVAHTTMFSQVAMEFAANPLHVSIKSAAFKLFALYPQGLAQSSDKVAGAVLVAGLVTSELIREEDVQLTLGV